MICISIRIRILVKQICTSGSLTNIQLDLDTYHQTPNLIQIPFILVPDDRGIAGSGSLYKISGLRHTLDATAPRSNPAQITDIRLEQGCGS